MDINGIIQLGIAIATLISVILIYKTIKSNQEINQKIIFNEVVKQERELRIKLGEYRVEIDRRIDAKKDFKEITLNYDTLLSNYYEYLAICLLKKFIREIDAMLYFKELLPDLKDKFEYSILFKEGYSEKRQYPGVQWLFRNMKGLML